VSQIHDVKSAQKTSGQCTPSPAFLPDCDTLGSGEDVAPRVVERLDEEDFLKSNEPRLPLLVGLVVRSLGAACPITILDLCICQALCHCRECSEGFGRGGLYQCAQP
jgi:hypothetical protein